MEEKQEYTRRRTERKAKVIGALSSILFTAGLAVLAIYQIIWSPPDPPIPRYGIEVNFGADDMVGGSEDIQSDAAPVEQPPQEDPLPVQEPVVEPKPEPVEQVMPEPQPETPAEPEPTPVDQQPQAQEDIETVDNGEVEVPPAEVIPEPEPTPSAPEVVEPDPEPEPEPEAIMPVFNKTNHGTADEGTGDAGSSKGKLNADAILPNSAGGAGGAALEMPGWRWIEPPVVEDKSEDTGKVVFEVQIDEDGEVISAKIVYSSVSWSVANLYKNAVKDLVFEPTDFDAEVDGFTVGRITFVIQAK